MMLILKQNIPTLSYFSSERFGHVIQFHVANYAERGIKEKYILKNSIVE